MKFSLKATLFFSAILAATLAQAKTFKYELTDINSNNGTIQFPRLDFNGATSAILTIEQDSPESEKQIKSLEIEFPQANKLVARDFKRDGSDYRTLVNNAWVYRQVIVSLLGPDLNPYNHGAVLIDVAVSEKESFINSNNGGDFFDQHLLMTFGTLTDVTPAKTVDTASAIVGGKRLNLALRSNLSTPPQPGGNSEGGFVIEASWMGKGDKTLYMPSGFPHEVFGFITPISLTLEFMGTDYMLSVTAKDQSGNVMPGLIFPLNDLLLEAYGPQL